MSRNYNFHEVKPKQKELRGSWGQVVMKSLTLILLLSIGACSRGSKRPEPAPVEEVHEAVSAARLDTISDYFKYVVKGRAKSLVDQYYTDPNFFRSLNSTDALFIPFQAMYEYYPKDFEKISYSYFLALEKSLDSAEVNANILHIKKYYLTPICLYSFYENNSDFNQDGTVKNICDFIRKKGLE